MKKPPKSAASHWLWKNSKKFFQNPPEYMNQQRAELGDFYALNFPIPNFYGLTHPDQVKYLLVTNNKNYLKDWGTQQLKLALGNGLLTNEGDFWRRQRRIAQPAFHRARLAALMQTMVDSTAERLTHWKSKQVPFDVAEEMTLLTSDIVSKTLFGSNVENLDEISESMHFINRYLTVTLRRLIPVPVWLPTSFNRTFKRHLKKIDGLIGKMVQDRRNHPENRNDLLAMLMEAQDEESGERMTDGQLRDECMTLFAAGHETSANSLAWTLFLLGKHPDIWERLRQEVKEILGNRLPTMDDLRQLPYTLQVIQESMRLYPPAWAIGREAIAADEVEGYPIKPKSQILMSPYAIHRHPDFWENPEEFDPERFSPENSKNRHKYAYLPFGGGPRLCIGNNFAMMEMQIVLAMITQKFRLKLTDDQAVEMEALITLKPRNGVWMEVLR